MELKDGMRVRGEVDVYVFDGGVDPARIPALLDDRTQPEWSRLASEEHISNMVTNLGRQQMTKLIVGESASLGNYIGLSTSPTTPSLAALALTDEIARNVCSIAASYLTYYQRKVAYFAPADFTSTGIAGEAIYDTASTGGSCWAITSLTASKSSAQGLVISHLIQATT